MATEPQPASPYTVATPLALKVGPQTAVLYDLRGWTIIDGKAVLFTSNKPSGVTDPAQPVTVQLVPVGQTHPGQGMASREVRRDNLTGLYWELFVQDVV
jgi:hypothetical protein